MKPHTITTRCCLFTILTLAQCAIAQETDGQWIGEPWRRHTIDDASRGADGVRLADINGDTRLDVVTGWEEGGQIRVCLQPSRGKANAKRTAVRQRWPSVLVGSVRKPEDAVFFDMDDDGHLDVVSSCEGNERSIYVHWSPSDPSQLLNSSAWKTEVLPASSNQMMWMFTLPMQVDGSRGQDLLAGAKGPGGQIGWYEAPAEPRRLADWHWHPIYKAGWIMSLFARDVDADGDLDVITTDRKGPNRGCHWLENPGAEHSGEGLWRVHTIGGQDIEMMFMTLADWDGDGTEDIVAAAKKSRILIFRRSRMSPPRWQTQELQIEAPVGSAKAVAVGDLNGDGRNDLVATCENAKGVAGVFWGSADAAAEQWQWHDIAGTKQGIKYDIVELVDLDDDGDLDVITCEERDNLGVIWYENPLRP